MISYRGVAGYLFEGIYILGLDLAGGVSES